MIKLITSKNQLRFGQRVAVYKKPCGTFVKQDTVTKIDNEGFYGEGGSFANYFSCASISSYYLEHLSFPERRRLSWDWVKEHIDELPCIIYSESGSESMLSFANKDSIRSTWANQQSWDRVLKDNLFIEPPLPEIPETIEPWLVKEEEIPKEPDEYHSVGILKIQHGFMSLSLTEFFNTKMNLEYDIYIKKEALK